MLGTIFRKAQNKIQDPAKLKRLISLMDGETWLEIDADVKGDIYEGLLERNAADVKSGAGQYFTPRPLIEAIVEVMRPGPDTTICDPACGTGGFLLAAHEYVQDHYQLDRDQKRFQREGALRGVDIVDGVVRLCAMNLYLRGIGGEESPVTADDSLRSLGSTRYDMVLTNPPFGKKSSYTVLGADGRAVSESQTYERDDFWATTSNKQLNFLQHVKSLLKIGGTAAVVVPDNVLFEGGAGETVRRRLLREYDVHTLLRLPTGIFYAQGVKANVLFFERKPASETPWTSKLWIYDLRTNQHFTLKQNTLSTQALQDFVTCYNAEDRSKRRGDGAIQGLRLRGAGKPRQGQPRHLLAQGQEPRRFRRLTATGRDSGGDRGEPGGCAGAVRGDTRGSKTVRSGISRYPARSTRCFAVLICIEASNPASLTKRLRNTDSEGDAPKP